MKKSILMAIVALALLSAPVFAGDYSIVGDIDLGFGMALSSDVPDGNTTVNDFTMLGFFGSIDDNNSIAIQMEYGTTGSGANINEFDHTNLDARGLLVLVTEFSLTTNVLGSFGLTDLPVTLSMTGGYGRLNLHNRFQQWTGWEIKRWKDNGAAHFSGDWSGSGFNPAAWERVGYIRLQVGILNMVNVAFGICPLFGTETAAGDPDVPFLIEAWTSGLAFGPVGLDIAANLRMDGAETRAGLQVNANMNFGALALAIYLGEDIHMIKDADGIDNLIAVAVKPSYNFGIGSVSLGVWMTMNTLTDTFGDGTQMDMAFDLAATFSKTTIYGGIIMLDLSDFDENDDSPMKLDVGIKQGFGAANISLGVTAMLSDGAAVNNNDIGAADGSGINMVDVNGDFTPTLYIRFNAWY